MSLKELDNLAEVGLLKIESADQNEFDGLLDSGRRRLVDAHKYEGYAYINMQLLTDLLKATDVVLKAVMKLGPVRIGNKGRK